MYIDLLLITIISVLLIDHTGFFRSMLDILWKNCSGTSKPLPDDLYWTDISPFLKPLECSLCTSFWLGLIYLLVTANLNLLSFAYLLLLSIMTPFISDLIQLIKDITIKGVRILSNIFE